MTRIAKSGSTWITCAPSPQKNDSGWSSKSRLGWLRPYSIVDIESLLKSLSAHDVKFVVIGAMAFPIHGYARATLDIDLFIEPTLGNAQRCRQALGAFGYDVTDCSAEDFLSKKVLIRQYVVACDVHPFVKGVAWEEVWDHRVSGKIGAASASFASLEDLIKMKEAAGRPKDVEDLKYLRGLRPDTASPNP